MAFYNLKSVVCLSILFLTSLNAVVADDEYSHIEDEQSIVIFDFNQDNSSDFERLETQYYQQDSDYSVLSNQLYQGQRFRVFNYTAYEIDNLKAVLEPGQGNADGISSLSISMGYGLEFLVNKRNKIGYEFLSSFPYNRGELIRFFWVSVF